MRFVVGRGLSGVEVFMSGILRVTSGIAVFMSENNGLMSGISIYTSEIQLFTSEVTYLSKKSQSESKFMAVGDERFYHPILPCFVVYCVNGRLRLGSARGGNAVLCGFNDPKG